MTRVRLKDVAEKAGTSPGTVSRVLNNRNLHQISKQTQQRIRQIAAQMGYAVDPVARAMKTGQSMTLGLSVTGLRGSTQAHLAEEIEHQCHLRGFELLVGIERDEPLAELARLRNRMVDGLILVRSSAVDDPNGILPTLQAQSFPFVCIGPPPLPGVVSVDWDRHGALQQLGTTLLAQGTRRMLLLGVSRSPGFEQRMRGLDAAVRSHQQCKLDIRTLDDLGVPNQPEPVRVAIHSLLSERRPDTLVVHSEHLAWAALAAAGDLGLSIPRDLAIACACSVPDADWHQPAWTSMELDYPQMASTAVGLLKDLTAGGDPADIAKTSRPLPPVIRWRQTTRTSP